LSADQLSDLMDLVYSLLDLVSYEMVELFDHRFSILATAFLQACLLIDADNNRFVLAGLLTAYRIQKSSIS